MPNADLGYRCRITFDGHQYTVSDVQGVWPSQTFFPIQVGFRAQLTANPDKTDSDCYCDVVQGIRVLDLTMPEPICIQIREGTFPTTNVVR
ncbi:MAG: hypothetical protein COT24_04880 [Candidatus Kerfeldbacteria bacterium CG08_land_8_20_14_0_20_40_16]|uniref:Uncharacterized protein n=1 Tax=Candidatus Kerfeldbacteria bacterium CG08_land_8_20_14_0_20_40_16 TaxID=2014244 RepID=A0A2H0YUT0_9BACT|nr:MAG: hypothetical protein COT24_04880 [Candidatus Kerfeldbacteria bacterium CG08_land_8_20_14_0_20_40_16]